MTRLDVTWRDEMDDTFPGWREVKSLLPCGDALPMPEQRKALRELQNALWPDEAAAA